MDILPLAPAMANAISHLHAACFPRPWSEGDFQAFLDDEDVFGSVITHDHALVGCILLRQTAEEAEILTLAVAPDHRRCGIAYTLMESSHRNAFQRGVRRISLEVACDNRGAYTLYKRLAYEQVGLRPAYYRRENGTTEDARVMVRSLATHRPFNPTL